MVFMKQCRICKKAKPLTRFVKRSNCIDGRLNTCKSCMNITAKLHRGDNLSRYRKLEKARAAKPKAIEYQQQYKQTEAYRESAQKSGKKQRLKFAHKYKAVNKVYWAIRYKRISKQPCFCGDEMVEGHHNDYNRPLEVTWLCALHHWQWHQQNRQDANAR